MVNDWYTSRDEKKRLVNQLKYCRQKKLVNRQRRLVNEYRHYKRLVNAYWARAIEAGGEDEWNQHKTLELAGNNE